MSVLTENTVQPMISSLGEPTIASGTTPNGTTTDGVPQKTKRRLCLTICTTRKPGLSEEEFGEYLMKIHGPLSKGLLAKYGMIRWSMVGNVLWWFLRLARVQCRRLALFVAGSSIHRPRASTFAD